MRLRMRDFKISIDDFGTGYSSLQKLQQLPFTELKIDKCFVMTALSDAGARSIIETSIRLAKQLTLRTVAEGVETKEVWNLMNSLGCDLAQGYFMARPMPLTHLSAWAKNKAGH